MKEDSEVFGDQGEVMKQKYHSKSTFIPNLYRITVIISLSIKPTQDYFRLRDYTTVGSIMLEENRTESAGTHDNPQAAGKGLLSN